MRELCSTEDAAAFREEELTTKKVQDRLLFCKKIYGLPFESGQERAARKR